MTNHKRNTGKWSVIASVILIVIVLAVLILKKLSCERSGGFWMIGSQGSACIVPPEGMFNGREDDNEGI